MSRIGKLPISIPSGVTVSVKDNVVTVKGPKGELSQYVDPSIEMKVEDGHITFARNSEDAEFRSKHGLYRALVNNMVVGVSQGYKKELELVGVGYRVSNQGQVIEFSLVLDMQFSCSCLLRSRSRLRVRRTRIHLLFWRVATSSC